jgi:hypothetical protein
LVFSLSRKETDEVLIPEVRIFIDNIFY